MPRHGDQQSRTRAPPLIGFGFPELLRILPDGIATETKTQDPYRGSRRRTGPCFLPAAVT